MGSMPGVVDSFRNPRPGSHTQMGNFAQETEDERHRWRYETLQRLYEERLKSMLKHITEM